MDLEDASTPPDHATGTRPAPTTQQTNDTMSATPKTDFPGTLEVPPSRQGASGASRKLSAPLPTEYTSSHNRLAALDRWQTSSGADRLDRAESIPSRAWVHWSSSLMNSNHGAEASSEEDSGDEDASGSTSIAKPTAADKARRDAATAPKRGIMGRILLKNEHCKSTGRARSDGRLRITVHETAHTGYIANALGAVAHSMRSKKPPTPTPRKIPPPPKIRPRLTIVIMVVGSRGDVQPFLRIGKYLHEQFGHRIRIATHPVFRDVVEKSAGLEFFSVGGDPAELMAFMVKNPGMIPKLETLRAGEIGRRRAAMAEMFDGFWKACILAKEDERVDSDARGFKGKEIFIADAIIANPPSFAHIHCAEALGIPLHLVFTFPYTPTHAFPHPLAVVKQTNVDEGYTNFISYPLVEIMTWQGLGDLVNKFRIHTLALDPVSTLWAPCATYRMHVPVTYLWSPSLVPKPQDWGDEIDVSGFVFLDLASSFEPPKALVEFLDAGETPIYIGFGSIVVDDAEKFTDIIFEAVEKAGVRALVSSGWGGFGRQDVPDNIFMLDNTPHDWLFPRLKACVHHGGAGTTAIGLKCGLPTMIIPFFGDQYFWGTMVGKSGAGPEPIPYKYLTADKLAEGIQYLLTDEAKLAAGEIAKSIDKEGDGAANSVETIQRHMRVYGPPNLSCAIIQTQVAVWEVRSSHIRLGVVAAHILVKSGLLSWKQLRLLRHTEWLDFEGPGEPVTAVAESLKNTIRDVFGGIVGAPLRVGKTAKQRTAQRIKGKKQKHPQDESPGGKQGPDTNDASGIGDARLEPSTVPGPDQYKTDLSRTLGEAALAIVKAPTHLVVALAQGFHNAPRLYGDDTVRRPTRISGIRSGLIASRRAFVYGLYDGATGLLFHPIRGAKNEGPIGLLKGAGMGIAGSVLKPISAIVGPFGYSMQGMVKQVERRRSPQTFVRHARMAQGENEATSLDAAAAETTYERVVSGWKVLQKLTLAIADEEGRRGLAGQVDKMTLDVAFLFANVDRAQTCLDDLESGKSLEDVMTTYKEWNVKSVDPNFRQTT